MARAKGYSRSKYALSILGTLYLSALLAVFLSFGLSKGLAGALAGVIRFRYLLVPAFLLACGIAYGILNFPFVFYATYLLERKYSLSSQKLSDWLLDELKSGAIGYILTLILLAAFYYVLEISPGYWWFFVSLFWIIFGLILARLTPIIIIPLFFKYTKLQDEALRQRILALADKMKVKILDVFEIDFSKKTLKANAAFVGMGRTRRVLLADTLKDKYTHDEIEVVLAHEFAHYQLRHILKLILANSAVTLGLFYLIFRTSSYFLTLFGLGSLSDAAAMPLVFLYFVVFGVITRPLEAYISRRFEKQADALALKTTANKAAFISMMNKLAGQNLADRSPHPAIKFFFFDHPPIDERIAMAEKSDI